MTNDIQVGKHFILHNGARKDVQIIHIQSDRTLTWVDGRQQARNLIKLLERDNCIDWNGTNLLDICKGNPTIAEYMVYIISKFKEGTRQ